ncbi:hypothetical protein BH20ACT10_BH20ACT10_23020 [soil metagenome]|jgi:hypothetical protein
MSSSVMESVPVRLEHGFVEGAGRVLEPPSVVYGVGIVERIWRWMKSVSK